MLSVVAAVVVVATVVAAVVVVGVAAVVVVPVAVVDGGLVFSVFFTDVVSPDPLSVGSQPFPPTQLIGRLSTN